MPRMTLFDPNDLPPPPKDPDDSEEYEDEDWEEEDDYFTRGEAPEEREDREEHESSDLVQLVKTPSGYKAVDLSPANLTVGQGVPSKRAPERRAGPPPTASAPQRQEHRIEHRPAHKRSKDFDRIADVVGEGPMLNVDERITATVPADDAFVSAELESPGGSSTRTMVETSQRYVREHDPMQTVEGVRAAIEASADEHDLDLQRCRAAFPKTRGRPSATLQAHRAAVRSALLPVYDATTYALMAEALGCSVRTLEVLLRPNRGSRGT